MAASGLRRLSSLSVGRTCHQVSLISAADAMTPDDHGLRVSTGHAYVLFHGQRTLHPVACWRPVSVPLRAEVAKEPLRVVRLPGLAWLVRGVLLVKADEQIDQLTADRLDPEQRGQ